MYEQVNESCPKCDKKLDGISPCQRFQRFYQQGVTTLSFTPCRKDWNIGIKWARLESKCYDTCALNSSL